MKDKGKTRKSKAATKLFASSNWPKVMISRDDRVPERTELFNEITPSSSKQHANGDEEDDEGGDCDVEHLCCDEKEPQIMIADSSSKTQNAGSLATALRDRGPYLIPVQPNRSLPIRPAPLPTRSFRKNGPSLTVLPKPGNLDVVEIDSAKPIGATSNESTIFQQQISNASNPRGTKKMRNDDCEQEKDCAKENKRKKKSHEPDSSQCREKNGLMNSLKDFIKTENCDDSLVAAGTNRESNYKIIKDNTSSCLRSDPSSTACNLLHERGTNPEPLNNNNCKVMYRRNRLKQKLCELRSKAEDLAKLMAVDSSSQQNTRLKQVMNRYEKQIENLSKLHNKLSAAFPSPDDPECPPKVEFVSAESNSNENESVEKKPTMSTSPEPPKLSPRSSTSYVNIPPEEIRNSPPILPRICLAITSSHDGKFRVTESKSWTVNNEELMDQTVSADSIRKDAVKKTNLGECDRTTENSLTIEANDFHLEQKYLKHSDDIVQLFEDSHSEEKKDEEKHEVEEGELSPGRLVIHEEDKLNSIDFPDPGPVIKSVISGPEAAATVSAGSIIESTGRKQILRTDSCQPSPKETRAKVSPVNNQNVQQVTSSSNQSIQIQFIEAPPRQETIILQQKYKKEKPSIDAAQENTSNYTMTEQFPTLGNWVARMSKNMGALPLNRPIENPVRVPTPKMQKTVSPNVPNDIMNTNLQYGTDTWQYYHPQQQRQQPVLQHVASVTLAQPVPMVPPPYRPAMYPPPIPMNQYYPNNYTMDPYNNATLGYHPAICSYGTYPYHSRLHPPSLSGYHFPMQEGLRPMQHPDKRYPPLQQEPIMKYSPPITNNLQQPSALPPDRLRGNMNGNNVGVPGLPSLYLPPAPLPSSQQALSGPILPGYATTNQLSRNRMIPDVVAAAAAAAVVAAASLGKQRDLACNVRKTDLSNPTMTNIVNSNTPCPGNSGKTEILHVNNQLHDSGYSEDIHQNSTKYQRMQNYLFDRLNLVARTNDLMQPGSTSDNRLQMTAVDSSTPQKIILPPQMTKTIAGHEFRNCETPHLGKVNGSPNSLHNLVCSNCGIAGPKFKCLGCEMVFYCDGRCQQKHWNLHVRRCPKKMPKLKKLS